VNLSCNNFYFELQYMVLYLCVLIVFSLRRESLKLLLVDEPLPEVVLSQHALRSSGLLHVEAGRARVSQFALKLAEAR
jgi:hypothetical protein